MSKRNSYYEYRVVYVNGETSEELTRSLDDAINEADGTGDSEPFHFEVFAVTASCGSLVYTLRRKHA